MKTKSIGFILIVLGITFGMSETIYFGNNFTPHSIAEGTCDILTIILVMLGFVLIKNKE